MDADGDNEYAEFVKARFLALQRFGYLLTGEWYLAEDLVQTSLAKVWFRRNALRSSAALESYTRRVMINTGTDWWRRRWKAEVPTEFVPEVAAPSQFGTLDERDRLMRALATLPRRTRAALVLRYFEDRTDREVADIMGCSISTVRSTVSRGLAKLRQHSILADAGAVSAARGCNGEPSHD